MATESDLRDLLRDPEPKGGGTIDVDAVLKRAHSRRRPRVIAATAVGALAMVGVFTPIVLSSLPRSASDSSALTSQDVSAGAAPLADDPEPERAKSAQALNLCAAPPVVLDAASNGLVLDVAPVAASATADSIEATVTLRNAGTEHLQGTTGIMPALTFFSDGGVLWHSNGMTSMIAVPIDLEPGETHTYTAAFEPLRCSPEDDANGFRDDLPEVGPGAYWLSAAIDFVPTDSATAGPVVVTGPAVAVELR